MPLYKADMHIHTVLSPCGDLMMSPQNIVEQALLCNINILAITDHNSTKMCKIVAEVAEEKGITVIPGVEITTKEEAHCLAYFYNYEQVNEIQKYIDEHLPFIQNSTEKFGYQLVVDKDEMIVEEVDTLLITALDVSIDKIEQKVHEIGGVFVPAHIDRPKYSILSQLGFIPPDLRFEALELSRYTTTEEFGKKFPMYSKFTFTQSSDAHFIENIGDAYTIYNIENPTLEEIVKAFKNQDSRKIESFGNKAQSK